MRRMRVAGVVVGGALLVVGSLLPLVQVHSVLRPMGPIEDPASVPEMWIEASVVDLSLDRTDAIRFLAGDRALSWPGRLLLAAAAASIALAAAQRRVLARIACALLLGAVLWLFAEAGAEPAEPAQWTAYPPFYTISGTPPLGYVWPAWAALLLGTALVLASTFPRSHPAPGAPPIP